MLMTDRFTECLKSLHLKEYPCHNRSPEHASTGGLLRQKEKSSLNEALEVEELLDLIKDKKSPWFEMIEWTNDGDHIRQTYIKQQSKFQKYEIENFFTSLRLTDLQIEKIDKRVKRFKNLKELILSCNLIEECDSSNLPDNIEIFELCGNYLTDLTKLVKKPMVHLKHFGLGYNWINKVSNCLNSVYWPAIRSLDLQFNQIDDLIGLIQDLSTLDKLKVLVLLGNPISLLPGYRCLVIDNFPNLIAFDDKAISREEKISSQDFNLYADHINEEVIIQFAFHQLRNLILPEQPEIEEGQPEINIYKYFIKFNCIDDSYDPMFDSDFKDSNQKGFHSMITYNNKEWKKACTYKTKVENSEEFDPSENIAFGEKGTIKLKYKSLKQLRDFILDGTEIEVIERKRYYQSKDYVPEMVVDAGKKKQTKAKDEKKDDTKKSKNKKGNNTQMLDNYNLINTDDKILATFNMELSATSDGLTREVYKKFYQKIKIEPKVETPAPAMIGMTSRRKSVQDKRKSADIKKGKGTETKVKIDRDVESVEILPMELDVTFSIVDFKDFKSLKSYFIE